MFLELKTRKRTKYMLTMDDDLLVRRAYKQKVLETHPDKLSPDATEEEKAEARERFSEVHEAFETLGDADQRRVSISLDACYC
ncbi:hypothetical protein BV25DRAFT_1831387 [Artomyces pyxidatus]|uniref:Uncharacterized protein n=1 Tax=Artomyces pyxidatus TaxID=48021 RepID=A0ACB8SKY7_9AGAM|nr:hypothetical protein BV25DRAFT_1831387 [Artomyces pyxidatus]